MKFTIPLNPVPKGRPRFSRFSKRPRTPDKTRKFEENVAFLARAAGLKPIEGPVYLRAEFYLPWPKTKHRKRNPLAQGWMTEKPDVDNYGKALLDALEGPCFASDAQVVWMVLRKYRAAQGHSGRIDVEICEAGEPDGRNER